MADYFTNFSVVLPLTKQQQEYAMQVAKQVEQHRFHDEPLPADFPESLKVEVENWTFETKANDNGIWIHSQYGGQDAACVFIQHLLQKFSFAGGVAFEWSHDCSKPRTDAYGGGATFITAKRIKTMTTHEWLRKMAALCGIYAVELVVVLSDMVRPFLEVTSPVLANWCATCA